MKRLFFALGIWIAASLPWAATAQVPPTPPGVAVLAGAATLSVTATTGNVALPSNITPYNAVTVYNYGTKDAYFALGGPTVTATTSSFPVRSGTAISVWVGTNTWIAAITGGSDTTSLQIYQSNGALNFSALTGGGGGSGVVTSIAGTANQITASASTGAVTLSLPSAVLFPGTIQTSGQAIINLNAAMLPTPVTGTVLQIVGANASNAFIENDSFGGTPILTGRRADGTGASPTTVQSGDVLAGFSARPYNGTAYTSASVANVQAVALENFTTGANGAYVQFNCTAITTLTTAECGRVTSTGFQGAIGATTASAGAFTTITNAGSLSGTATTTTGSRIIQGAATVTDTTSTGTVAADYVNRFGITTLAASSATTYTNAYGSWFEPPAAGTNVTLTKAWAAGFNGAIFSTGGSSTTPGIGVNSTISGLSGYVANQVAVIASASPVVLFGSIRQTFLSGYYLGWASSSTDPTASADTGISRGAAGIVDIGTGAAGSTAGTLQAANYTIPTATSSAFLTATDDGAGSPMFNFNGGAGTGVGVATLETNSSFAGFRIRSLSSYGWSASNGDVTGAGPDTVLTRFAAANIHQGKSDAAAPVPQTFGAQSVVTGTPNTAGALWKHTDSGGTGTGASGGYEFDVHPAGSTGSTPNAASSAFALSGAGIPSFPLIGTDAAATDTTACVLTGGIIAKGTGTLGVCLGTSSKRYKTPAGDLEEGLSEVMALKPVKFYLDKAHGDPSKLMYGFYAEDGVKVLPHLVGLDNQGRPNTFDYLGVVPVLVHAVQQQEAEISDLKAKLASEDSRISRLEQHAGIQTAANDDFFDRVGFALFGTR